MRVSARYILGFYLDGFAVEGMNEGKFNGLQLPVIAGMKLFGYIILLP